MIKKIFILILFFVSLASQANEQSIFQNLDWETQLSSQFYFCKKPTIKSEQKYDYICYRKNQKKIKNLETAQIKYYFIDNLLVGINIFTDKEIFPINDMIAVYGKPTYIGNDTFEEYYTWTVKDSTIIYRHPIAIVTKSGNVLDKITDISFYPNRNKQY